MLRPEDLVSLAFRPIPLALASMLTAISCGGDICDAGDLASALIASQSGDTVAIGNCIVTGNFVVPPGVTVTGLGKTKSRLVSEIESDPLLLLETGTGDPTHIQELGLESLGRAAILTRGDGAIALEYLGITVSRGLGIGSGGTSSVQISGVTLLGPVTRASAGNLSPTTTATETATFGIAFANTDVELTGVDIQGFGFAGAAFIDTDVDWRDGIVTENHPIGIYASGAQLSLAEIEVSSTFQGTRPAAFGGFFDGSEVETTDVSLIDGEGYGLFHLGGTASHLAFSASGNNHAAIWGQSMSSLSVEGTINDNAFAGIVAASVDQLTLSNVTVSNTNTVRKLFDTYGAREIGDGIQLVYPIMSATVENVTLENNGRIGMLLELAGQTLGGITFTNVSATVTSTVQGGVVAQNGTAPGGWDSGVTRNGTTDAADRSFGTVPSVGVVGPCDYPRAFDGSLVTP